MGAGCNYTMRDVDTRAYWVDVDNDGEDDDYSYQDTLDNLKSIIAELPLSDSDAEFYGSNNQYRIALESTYYGDGIVIDLQYRDDENITSFDKANLYPCYAKIIKHINKYYTLRIASSGYTSSKIDVGQAKP